MKTIVAIIICIFISGCNTKNSVVYSRGEMYNKWQQSVIDYCNYESWNLTYNIIFYKPEMDTKAVYNFLNSGCLIKLGATI